MGKGDDDTGGAVGDGVGGGGSGVDVALAVVGRGIAVGRGVAGARTVGDGVSEGVAGDPDVQLPVTVSVSEKSSELPSL